jgi:hypothetical protein
MIFPMDDGFEAAVRRSARTFGYPKMPDVALAVRGALRTPRSTRGLTLLTSAAVLAMLVAVVMLAVPGARALIAGWFRIGVINISPVAPSEATSGASNPVTATPSTSTYIPTALRDLSGLTTLDEAQRDFGFGIRLPGYPADLGDPDLLYHQPLLDLVVLVWLDESDPDTVQLSLFEFLSSNPIVNKFDPTVLAESNVNGSPALWLEGPYPLQVRSGDLEWMRIVKGRSLVWESDGITYRLESLLTLDESLRIAESIR